MHLMNIHRDDMALIKLGQHTHKPYTCLTIIGAFTPKVYPRKVVIPKAIISGDAYHHSQNKVNLQCVSKTVCTRLELSQEANHVAELLKYKHIVYSYTSDTA